LAQELRGLERCAGALRAPSPPSGSSSFVEADLSSRFPAREQMSAILLPGGGSPQARLRQQRPSTAPPEADAEAQFEDTSSLGGQGGVLRKKLYDQNLSDWSARYRKNKQNLDCLARDCELLRGDVARQQQEADERAEAFNSLEDKFANEVMVKYTDTKNAYDLAMQQKNVLQVQLSENRKHKTQLAREKKLLSADYERKHSELMRMAEQRDKLDSQLAQLTHQLGHLTSDRRRMERELDHVQHNLRANTELADEVNCEIEHVFDGIKDSMDMHMAPMSRLETSSITSSRGGYEGPPSPG